MSGLKAGLQPRAGTGPSPGWGGGRQLVLTSRVSRASISVREKLCEERGEVRPGGGGRGHPAAGRPGPGPAAVGGDAPWRGRSLPAPGVLPVARQRPQLVVGEGALQVVLVGVVEHGAHPLPEAQAQPGSAPVRLARSRPAPLTRPRTHR